MKLNYHPETDSLYIDLSEKTSVETREFLRVFCLITMLTGTLSASILTMQAARFNSKTSSLASCPQRWRLLPLNNPAQSDRLQRCALPSAAGRERYTL